MPGTGLYATKAAPTKNDDTQSGAPAGQVITLVTGGLGTADAFKGGYVLNVTETETLAIVSHTDTTITLEGDLTNWTDTDDLDIYDAWSTIQGALDQLFTDQGTTKFTAAQYIRIFAGTYDEGQITPSTSLLGSAANGYGLVIEGDPTDDRSNIIIAPTSGAYGLRWYDDGSEAGGLLRHLSFAGVPTTGCLLCGSILRGANRVRDCAFAPTNSATGAIVNIREGEISGCTITSLGGNRPCLSMDYGRSVTATNCVITGAGAGEGTNHVGVLAYGGAIIEGCTIRDCATGIFMGASGGRTETWFRYVQNTIYNCTNGIQVLLSTPGHVVINNIIKDCTYVWKFSATEKWPEINDTRVGGAILMRNNCAHGYTNFAYDGTDAKTYAEFIAFNQVDAAGDLDDTDPLLTAPATDDFSLATGSPCLNAGHGSGVITGINDVAFDANVPDIGAWSSGVFQLINPVISGVSANFDGDSFDMTVSNTKGRLVNVYTSPSIPSTFTLEPGSTSGDGVRTITGKTAGTIYNVYCVTIIGTTIAGVSNVVKVLITSPFTDIPDTSDEDISILPGVDLLLDDDRDLALSARNLLLVDGSALVTQRLAVGLQLFKGEWFLDAEAGIPWYQEILEKGIATAVIDAILRAKIIETSGVNRILEYSSSIDAASRTVSVAFTVDTVYGPVDFEGALL